MNFAPDISSDLKNITFFLDIYKPPELLDEIKQFLRGIGAKNVSETSLIALYAVPKE